MDIRDTSRKIKEVSDEYTAEGGWYGIATPVGWSDIVLETHERIVAAHPDYRIYQVKEKFGGLRYYCSVELEDDVRVIVREAEEKALVTCQQCGTDGATRRRMGFTATLCDVCAEKQLAGYTPVPDELLFGYEIDVMYEAKMDPDELDCVTRKVVLSDVTFDKGVVTLAGSGGHSSWWQDDELTFVRETSEFSYETSVGEMPADLAEQYISTLERWKENGTPLTFIAQTGHVALLVPAENSGEQPLPLAIQPA